MKKQLEIFHSLVSEFQKDSTVEGILLNGSVAAGTATELSDLDMIVLGKKDGFVSKTIDTVPVEIHFVVFDSAVKKLESNPMEVYKYLDAKVEYDNGKAREIISYACRKNFSELPRSGEGAAWACLLAEKYEAEAGSRVFKAGYAFGFLSFCNQRMEGVGRNVGSKSKTDPSVKLFVSKTHRIGTDTASGLVSGNVYG